MSRGSEPSVAQVVIAVAEGATFQEKRRDLVSALAYGLEDEVAAFREAISSMRDPNTPATKVDVVRTADLLLTARPQALTGIFLEEAMPAIGTLVAQPIDQLFAKGTARGEMRPAVD